MKRIDFLKIVSAGVIGMFIPFSSPNPYKIDRVNKELIAYGSITQSDFNHALRSISENGSIHNWFIDLRKSPGGLTINCEELGINNFSYNHLIFPGV